MYKWNPRYTDTLFAQVKPIHKTPVPIITLSIYLRLFETGIKIELFGGAGVGKTVVIMEFIRNLATEQLSIQVYLYLLELVKEHVKEMIYIVKCKIQVLLNSI